MAHRTRGVPWPPKVDIFYREVGGDQKIKPRFRAQDGAVVPDAAQHGAVPAGVGEAADGADELFLGDQPGPASMRRCEDGSRNCEGKSASLKLPESASRGNIRGILRLPSLVPRAGSLRMTEGGGVFSQLRAG